MGWLDILLPGIGTAVGAIASGVKSRAANKEAKRINNARAIGIKYSPWTGYKAGERAQTTDTFSNVLGGGLLGAKAGFGVSNAINTRNTLEEISKTLKEQQKNNILGNVAEVGNNSPYSLGNFSNFNRPSDEELMMMLIQSRVNPYGSM